VLELWSRPQRETQSVSTDLQALLRCAEPTLAQNECRLSEQPDCASAEAEFEVACELGSAARSPQQVRVASAVRQTVTALRLLGCAPAIALDALDAQRAHLHVGRSASGGGCSSGEHGAVVRA